MKIIVDQNIPYLEALADVADVTRAPAESIDARMVRDADALVVRTRTRCDAALLDGSRVRFIGSATIGMDHIDTAYCHRRGITVRNAPGCNAPAVAQWVYSAIFRHGGGTTIGVVGVGHVGSIVARWGEALGLRVLLNDPPRAAAGDALPFVPLEQIADEADIITFHTPLTRDGAYPTFHLCDEAFLRRAKGCRLLMNAARGAIVDSHALLTCFDGDFALDCWENEPHPLPELVERAVVATPHIAGYSRQGKLRATAMILKEMNAFFGWQVPVPQADTPITGAETVSAQAIVDSYDIDADSRRLKAAPERFEWLRNHYPLRPELPVS